MKTVAINRRDHLKLARNLTGITNMKAKTNRIFQHTKTEA